MATESKKIKTATLLNRLFKAASLEDFLTGNRDQLATAPFADCLLALLKQKGRSRAEVIRLSTIERSYAYQLFAGRRKPSRDKVLLLAFGFGLDVEEAQALLKAAQMTPLYPKIKRDAAVLFALHHHKSAIEAQQLLGSLELSLLGREDA